MKIDKLNEVCNSPLRVLENKDSLKLHRDFSLLIADPTFQRVWVDREGRLHQKISIVNMVTLLSALVDRIRELVSGLSLESPDKAFLLMIKAREILTHYVPLILSQETQFSSSNDSEKIARLQSLLVKLDSLAQTISSNSTLISNIESKKESVSLLLDSLLAECHFEQLSKTATIGSNQLTGQSVQQKFHNLSPLRLEPSHFTKNHIEMIRRAISTAPEEMKKGLEAHAARHFCALQKGDTKGALALSLECAQLTLSKEDLLEAAREFKVIPLALQNKAEGLALLLEGLSDENAEFAIEVTACLEKISGGKEQIEQMIEKESRHANNPEMQERYLKRILFLQRVCPHSEKLEALFQDLEYLAIYGDLPDSCVQQLMPRGCITQQLVRAFEHALEMAPQEKRKILKELLPLAVNLYAKSHNEQVREFIDELVLTFFEAGSTEDFEAVMSSALADAFASGSALKSKQIVSSLLTVYAATQTETMGKFFKKTLLSIPKMSGGQGVAILENVIDQFISALPNNQLAMSSLGLIQGEIAQAIAEGTHPAEFTSLSAKIATGLQAFSKRLAKENLQGKFTENLKQLLSFMTGMGDLEALVRLKVNQLGRELKTAESRANAKNYLHVFHEGISALLKSKPDDRLSDLKEVIERVLGQSFMRLKSPSVDRAVLRDLEIKILDQNLALHLYKPDGSLAQEPFRRPA